MIRRLQEVRQRLDDLRDLVQQYRGLDGAAGVDESGDGRKTSSSVNFEDPELMSNLRRLERGEPVGRFQSAHQALLQQVKIAFKHFAHVHAVWNDIENSQNFCLCACVLPC